MNALREEATRTGSVLNGAYEIGALLGSGGMGYVYRAREIATGNDVAVKILRAQHVSNQTLVGRFIREARAAALAKHPNIVAVLDAGLDDKGTPYIVQELLSGEDLSQHLSRAGGRLSAEEALRVILPAADGMAYAHERGVIHRDLKPENIFLARDQYGIVVPKILDFGVSKIASEERTVDDGTKAGTILGTPEYMSPEQIQDGRTIDVRADVWALGVILYELLAGDIPFSDRGSRRIFFQICLGDPIPLQDRVPDVHPDLARIIERCLRRDREARYPTAAELARDLKNVAAQRPVEPTQRLVPAPRPGSAAVVPNPRHVPAARESAATLDEGSVVAPQSLSPSGRPAPSAPTSASASDNDTASSPVSGILRIADGRPVTENRVVAPPPAPRQEITPRGIPVVALAAGLALAAIALLALALVLVHRG